MVNFDTLKASHRLRDAGFEEKQADALVNAFAQDIGANLATKDDIALLLKEIANVDEAIRKDMASEFAAVRQEMASGDEALRQEMALQEERMNARFERQTARMTQLAVGMTGLVLAAIGIAAGILATL